jgi:hypothetical protein
MCLLLFLLPVCIVYAESDWNGRLTEILVDTISIEDELNHSSIDLSACNQIDISPFLVILKERIARFDRSEEFEYLFENLDKDIAEGRLKVVSTSDQLSLPGFQFLVEVNSEFQLNGVIAIQTDELNRLSNGDMTLSEEASVFSAIGEYYYTIYYSLYPFHLNGRNLLNEYSGHLTGQRLGAILYNEMSDPTERGDGRTLIGFAAASAENDELSGYSATMRCTHRQLVYDLISKHMQIGYSGNVEFVQSLAGLSFHCLEWISNIDISSLDQNQVIAASNYGYSVQVFVPWVLYGISNTNYVNTEHPYHALFDEILSSHESGSEIVQQLTDLYIPIREEFISRVKM